MLKHCFSLKTFIPKFVAFFVPFRNCNIFHSQDVVSRFLRQNGVYAGHCFIIHLLGCGQCPLVRDSEPIRLLEIPTSLCLYRLIYILLQVSLKIITINSYSGLGEFKIFITKTVHLLKALGYDFSLIRQDCNLA